MLVDTLPVPIKDHNFSLWSEEPSRLASFRSSAKLPNSCDLVIVGSGFTGASVAYHAPWGSVVMLEARDLCSGASGRNGGHLAPNVITPDDNVYAFEQMNYDAVHHLIDELGLDCWVNNDRQNVGYMIYENANGFGKAKQMLAKTQRHVHILEGSETRRTEWQPQLLAGAVARRASQINPYKLVTGLVEHCVDHRGLQLYTNVVVDQMESLPEGVSVYTSLGRICAQKVVLATNAYSGALDPDLKRKITPVRGQVHQFRLNDSTFPGQGCSYTMDTLDSYLSVHRGHEYAVLGGGRRLAPTFEEGVVDDNETSELVSAGIVELAAHSKLIGDPVRAWTGIMGFTVSGDPVVGPVRPGVWVAAGFSGHGMTRIFLTAKALVERMQGPWPEWFPVQYQYSG